MSSALLGYHVLFPIKLTDKEKKECLRHLNDLAKLIKSQDFIYNLARETSNSEPLSKQLYELSPWAAAEIDNFAYNMEDKENDIEEDGEEYEEHFDNVLSCIPEAKKFIENINLDYNDVSYRVFMIMERKFITIFAGCETWGDEPDGTGYQTLKDLDKVGLINKIEKLTIPNTSQSIHFIKDVL